MINVMSGKFDSLEKSKLWIRVLPFHDFLINIGCVYETKISETT
jgi:hypothetical protein